MHLNCCPTTWASRDKTIWAGIPGRTAKLAELVAEDPSAHFLLWHDLEAERHAIAAAIPEAVSVWGSQDLDEREQAIVDFSDGKIKHLATKPVIAGSGCNFQRHCHRAIFAGIGFKFADFIRAIHRIHRFLQTEPVRIDLIYTEAERGIRAELERKWREHNELTARMGEIIRTYGLSREAMSATLTRAAGVRRHEITGDGYRLVNGNAVEETMAMAGGTVDLIVTSIPVLDPVRVHAVVQRLRPHRVQPALLAADGLPHPRTTAGAGPGPVGRHPRQGPDRARRHDRARIPDRPAVPRRSDRPLPALRVRLHGAAHGRDDVVRENNQTYRLGWTEQCKDGTKMGCGMPEYLILLRKPPTDTSRSYADTPVVKAKGAYSRSRWQIDAHGFWRSSGNRPLAPEDLAGQPHDRIFQLFRDNGLTGVYDYEQHVALGEALEARRRLPTSFMLLQPPSWHPGVWTDVARMRTLNMMQERKGQQQHLCPMPFDIVDRLIAQLTMEGETVFDPFAGLMTVPYCALKLRRRGVGIELNLRYFSDGAAYVQSIARAQAVPTLFDLLDAEHLDAAS